MLLLFALTFNIGIYAVIHYSYKEEYENTKQQAARESYFLMSSFYNDFYSIDELSTLTYDKIEIIFNGYQKYYKEQGISLEFYEGSSRLHGAIWEIAGDREELKVVENEQNILTRTIQGKSYIFISGRLQGDYSRYMLVLSYPLDSLEATRENMLSFIIKIDIIFMSALAVLLAVIIKKVFTPLVVLSKATDNIAKGNYSNIIEIRGRNEFGELAEKFNIMSKKIEEKIEDIRLEGERRRKLVENMSHELRTPLTSISGYAEYMMMAEIDEEEKQEVLNYIVAESRRLSNLSNSLLSIADFRENRIEMEKLQIQELEDFLRKTFSHKIKEKSIKLDFFSEAKILRGNRDMVEMLFSNLIENAVRACDVGGHVTVTFEKKDNLVTKISDNGIGMVEEEVQKIKEPFYRVDKARSREAGGVGLGVTLCQQIVECHGAKMRYESELGRGTTVEIIWNNQEKVN